jgi:hypothetical protein
MQDMRRNSGVFLPAEIAQRSRAEQNAHEAHLRDRTLAVTAADSYTIDNISLLCLISDRARLFWPGWPAATSDGLTVAIFPAPHAKQEAHNIALLLPP